MFVYVEVDAAAAFPVGRFVGYFRVDFVELLIDDAIIAVLQLLAIVDFLELARLVWVRLTGFGLFATVDVLACQW